MGRPKKKGPRKPPLKPAIGYTTLEERALWQELAEKEGRTLSNIIITLLREYFKGRTEDPQQHPTEQPKPEATEGAN